MYKNKHETHKQAIRNNTKEIISVKEIHEIKTNFKKKNN